MVREHSISVVLPVYKQSDHIAQVVQEYDSALAKIRNPYELILVVNGKQDASLEVCQALAAKHDTIKVVYSEKSGWGRAVIAGLNAASGNILCYTNSARTTHQDLTLMLVYALVYPHVVVKANRKIRESWQRRLGSLLYNLECRALFDLSYWDINGTPKVFPRTFDKLLNLKWNDDLIDAEFNAICRRENYPVIEVPVFSTRRFGGKSTTNYLSAIKMYWGAYRMWQQFQQSAK